MVGPTGVAVSRASHQCVVGTPEPRSASRLIIDTWAGQPHVLFSFSSSLFIFWTPISEASILPADALPLFSPFSFLREILCPVTPSFEAFCLLFHSPGIGSVSTSLFDAIYSPRCLSLATAKHFSHVGFFFFNPFGGPGVPVGTDQPWGFPPV